MSGYSFDKFYDYGTDASGIPYIQTNGGAIVAKFPKYKGIKIYTLYYAGKGNIYVYFKTNKTNFVTDLKGNKLIEDSKLIRKNRQAEGEDLLIWGSQPLENGIEPLTKHQVYVHGKKFTMNLHGNMVDHIYNKESGMLYTFHKSHSGKSHHLYINGEKQPGSWHYADVGSFCSTPDGKYAFLYRTEGPTSGYEVSEHKSMYPWKLCYNGKLVDGMFGWPIYSPADKGIIVPRQVGANIVGHKL